MFGRNRNVRLLGLATFLFIAFFLYTRRGGQTEEFELFHPDAVGGGSVIRPKLSDIPANEAMPLPQPPPKPESVVAPDPPPVAPQPVLPGAPPPELPLEPEVIKSSRIQKAKTTSSPRKSSSSTTIPSLQTSLPVPAAPGWDDSHHDPIAAGNAQGRVEVSSEIHPTQIKQHYSKFPEHFPISSTIQLPSGTAKPFPRIQKAVKQLAANGADEEKLAAVKTAANHAWSGYREKAFGKDEVKPVSGRFNNPFNGWGATLIDSLDTLWIMGMVESFEEALKVVEKTDFTWSPRSDIPVFETTIRYLGGLVAAYDVSGRKYRVLLDKAVELAEVLYGVFDTPNRMPQTYYRWMPAHASQPGRAGSRAVLAEIGTLNLEFTRLAQLTGEPKYYDAVARITDALEEFQSRTRLPGMWPTTLDASGCGKPPQMIVQGSRPERILPVPGGSDDDMEAGAPVSRQRPQASAFNDTVAWRSQQHDDDELDKDRITHDDYSSYEDPNKKTKRQLDAGAVVKPVSDRAKLQSEIVEQDKPPMDSSHVPHRYMPTGEDACVPQGLNSSSRSSQEVYTLGGASDSLYEYLPKQDMLLGGQVDQYHTMYLDSAATAIENLLFKPMTPDERDILISGSMRMSPNYSTPEESRTYLGKLTPEIEHLTCFAGGMFAMGGVLYDHPEHVEIGAKLTDGCVWAYNITSTGIMPEGAVLMECDETWGDCPYNQTAYWKLLDPYELSRTSVRQGSLHAAAPTADVEVIANEIKALGPSKRDLTGSDALSIEPLSPQAPQAQAAQPQPAAQPGLPDVMSPPPAPEPQAAPAIQPADKPSQPDLVQISGNRQNNANVPEYIPPPPLSHKDYVEKKITEERLPPGFVRINSRKYILRPEAIESVFYMYRITGNQYWRDAGWNMFTAIASHTSAPYGASAIDDVTKTAPTLIDEMESFWLAETLKYFYLLFDEPDNWSLDEWVLNTEAHFFRRPTFEFVESEEKAPRWRTRVKRAVFGRGSGIVHDHVHF